MTHVYVIQAEGGPVKVGIATDPGRRLTVLQTASFARLSLYFAGEVPFGRAARVEADAHRRLADSRRVGEWFDIPAAMAVEALRNAAGDLGLDLGSREPARLPDGVTMNAAQCRMARAALQIGVRELATAAKVSPSTVARLEAGEDLRQAADALAEAGFLLKDPSGQRKRAERVGGKTMRVFRVSHAILEGDEE